MYKLTSENLTNLGGPMGTEYTYPNWEKYFNTILEAKKYAEKDFAKDPQKRKLTWTRENKQIYTKDMGYVMYEIVKVKVEK